MERIEPDITALIMDDHEWLRRQFARLDDARTPEELEAVWSPLAERLEAHAQAEETVFYPVLLDKGEDAQDETDDAIGDHNKIRDAVRKAAQLEIGSDEWYEAVGEARSENADHLAEEETESLPDFRKHAGADRRRELGALWVQFYANHPHGHGIDHSDRNVEDYIENPPDPESAAT